MAGRVVFVAGGCGFVGSGVAKAFLEAGSKVVVASRSRERLEDFFRNVKDKYRTNLTTVQGDVTTEEGLKVIKDGILNDLGKVDDVVSSVGSWWDGGPLTQQTLEEFRNQIHSLAGSHFLVAKTFLPYLAENEGTSYTFVTGQIGEKCFDKNTSLGTIGSACLFGISEAARAEYYHTNVAVNEARLGVFIMPKADATYGFHRTRVGNDYMGKVIAAIVSARQHEVVRVSSRDQMSQILKRYNVEIKDYKPTQEHWVEG